MHLLKQVGAAALLAIGLSQAQAALCTLQGATSVTVCFGSTGVPNGNVTGAAADARSDFDGLLLVKGVESFTGKDAGATSPLAMSYAGSTITGGVSGQTLIPSPVPGGEDEVISHLTVRQPTDPDTNEGRFGTSGSGFAAERFLEVGQGELLFTFSQGISAFGFYATDFGDFSNEIEILAYSGTAVQTFSFGTGDGTAPNGSLLFWGFVDSGKLYDSIKIRFTNPSDGVGLDDVVAGLVGQTPPPNPTPEPAGLALFGAALAAAALARRRSRRAD